MRKLSNQFGIFIIMSKQSSPSLIVYTLYHPSRNFLRKTRLSMCTHMLTEFNEQKFEKGYCIGKKLKKNFK